MTPKSGSRFSGWVAALFALLAATPAVHACLWDSDTLAAEEAGLPGTVDVIVGRFDRNPPLYYEMRLQRVTEALRSDPSNLEAYDDAGVACDRLKRGAEAIGWMDAKRRVLDRLPHSDPRAREHRYRYLANVGTFWAHRWLREGADRKRLDMLRKGRDFIREAIRLNPDAHFGREKYQLLAIEWILKPPKVKGEEPGVPSFFASDDDPTSVYLAKRAASRYPDAVRGVSGLVVLGDAWESLDVYNALTIALFAEEHSSLAVLADMRCAELAAAGRESLHPQALRSERLREQFGRANFLVRSLDAVRRSYPVLRRAADERHRLRTEFMLARLKAGRHPDTDPKFWESYREPARPRLPGTEWELGKLVASWLGTGVLVLLLIRLTRRATRAVLAWSRKRGGG
jgi:hypothetical protein